MRDKRSQEQLHAVRDLVDFLLAHPKVPVPCEFTWHTYTGFLADRDDFLIAARDLDHAEKESGTDFLYLRRQFAFRDEQVDFRIAVAHKEVCTKRVVGTRHVPEYTTSPITIPAHDEEIIEWDCPESLLAPTSEALDEKAKA